jgi:hypothetical protein
MPADDASPGAGLSGDDAATVRGVFDRAFALLGVRVLKWRDAGPTLAWGSGKVELSLDVLPAAARRPGADADDRDVAADLAQALGVPLPAAVFADPAWAGPRLRPVLLRPEDLTGPRRTACRREAFGNLVVAVAVGPAPTDAVLTTATLDAWKAEFSDVLARAQANLADRLLPGSIEDIAETQGLKAIMRSSEPASAAALAVESFAASECGDAAVAGAGRSAGVAFSVPTRELCLALPITPGAGPTALAHLVQMTFSICTRRPERVLSDQLFWRRGGETVLLPTTQIIESAGRRVTLEPVGPNEQLLDILGEGDDVNGEPPGGEG